MLCPCCGDQIYIDFNEGDEYFCEKCKKCFVFQVGRLTEYNYDGIENDLHYEELEDEETNHKKRIKKN